MRALIAGGIEGLSSLVWAFGLVTLVQAMTEQLEGGPARTLRDACDSGIWFVLAIMVAHPWYRAWRKAVAQNAVEDNGPTQHPN